MNKSVSDEEYEFIEGEGIPDCSRIGYTEDGFEIFIGTDDPGRIPHFHYRNADRSVNTSIQIMKAEYFFLGKYRGYLSREQRLNLQKFMLSSPDGCSFQNCSMWEYIVEVWNMNNDSGVRIDLNGIKQPDYTTIQDCGEDNFA